MRWGFAVSARGQTGQSDVIYSQEERRGQIDHASGLIDGGRLYRGDLVLAERLAHDIEATGKRRIAKAAPALPCAAGPDRQRQGLFRIDELGLRPGQLAPVSRTSKLTAPAFERLARTPWPMASLASSGIKALSGDNRQHRGS
jgi:hypothetical protein